MLIANLLQKGEQTVSKNDFYIRAKSSIEQLILKMEQERRKDNIYYRQLG